VATAMAQQVRLLVGGKVDLLEQALSGHLTAGPEVLSEAARNVLESGGKRLRPFLHLLSSELLGYEGDDDVLFATVIEYIHVASLLHDDVIDEAVLRRGNPTLNQKFGDTLTVLVGDYLCMKAQAMAVEHGDLDILGLVSKTLLDLVAGETLQEHGRGRLDVSEDEYLEIVELKTGRLMSASCEIAAILAGEAPGSDRRARLREYGLALGRAFQLTDDILDFESDEATLGKPVLSDLREGTMTLPAIHALREGGPEARRLLSTVLEEGGFESVGAEDVLDLVERCGGLDETRRRAASAAEAARSCLVGFPDGLPRDALEFAADFAAGRKF